MNHLNCKLLKNKKLKNLKNFKPGCRNVEVFRPIYWSKSCTQSTEKSEKESNEEVS